MLLNISAESRRNFLEVKQYLSLRREKLINQTNKQKPVSQHKSSALLLVQSRSSPGELCVASLFRESLNCSFFVGQKKSRLLTKAPRLFLMSFVHPTVNNPFLHCGTAHGCIVSCFWMHQNQFGFEAAVCFLFSGLFPFSLLFLLH